MKINMEKCRGIACGFAGKVFDVGMDMLCGARTIVEKAICEMDRKDAFAALGQKYYGKYKTSPDPEFAGLCDAIDEIQNKIDEKNAERVCRKYPGTGKNPVCNNDSESAEEPAGEGSAEE